MPIYVKLTDLSYYNVTESAEVAVIEAHKISGVPPAGSQKDALEAYKLEYEKCAQRYDDVYKAAWTNFSYMAIVAGAILTFGGDRFLPQLSALLACLPLLFWWLASFEPLNRYGDQVIRRLRLIELILTDLYQLDTLNEAQKKELANEKGLRHFRNFQDREGKNGSIPKDKKFRWFIVAVIFAALLTLALDLSAGWKFNALIRVALAAVILGSLLVWLVVEYQCFLRRIRDTFRQFMRVRFMVRCFAAVLLITAICLGVRVYQLHVNEGKPLLVQKDSELKVIPVDFNDNVGVKLDGITAKQAYELLQKAEAQKTASQAGK